MIEFLLMLRDWTFERGEALPTITDADIPGAYIVAGSYQQIPLVRSHIVSGRISVVRWADDG